MNLEDALHVLNLPIGATKQDIKVRFRELAKLCHPDVFPETDQSGRARAEERFKTLMQAVDCLAGGYAIPAYESSGRSDEDRDGPEGFTPPFDPRDVYGSTYAYSFAQRNPESRDPFVGCAIAFTAAMVFGLAIQEYGALGGGAGIALVLATVWLRSRIPEATAWVKSKWKTTK